VLSGSSLRPIWSRQFKASHLSRVVADSVQLSAALVPWNLMAVLISTIIGVRVWEYLPYTAYIWSLPLISLAYSFYLMVMENRNRPEKAQTPEVYPLKKE
ncbi:MAG: Na+/H+ antiporter NhaC family protein, partial [Syntrophomonadaceae bacterium]